MNQAKVTGKVVAGYQVASGTGVESPYPQGSITMQKPVFKKLGLDLEHCFDGTLNVDIAPHSFSLLSAPWRFEQVNWVDGFSPENFSFIPCELLFRQSIIPAFIYYPDPETKTQHFHNTQRLEVLAPWVDGIKYGDSVSLLYDEKHLNID
ncbi:MAG: hypothetical protein ACFHVJ_09520 [Aestuariibacter sp.]